MQDGRNEEKTYFFLARRCTLVLQHRLWHKTPHFTRRRTKRENFDAEQIKRTRRRTGVLRVVRFVFICQIYCLKNSQILVQKSRTKPDGVDCYSKRFGSKLKKPLLLAAFCSAQNMRIFNYSAYLSSLLHA